jgi:MFS family permease
VDNGSRTHPLPGVGGRGLVPAPTWHQTALILTFILLVWQGFGGGFTANAWTSLITKIMPSNLHGTFFGAQMAAFTGLEGLSAVAAGLILDRLDGPLDFTICFLAACVSFGVSFVFISLTREPDGRPRLVEGKPEGFWKESAHLENQQEFCRLSVHAFAQPVCSHGLLVLHRLCCMDVRCQ